LQSPLPSKVPIWHEESFGESMLIASWGTFSGTKFSSLTESGWQTSNTVRIAWDTLIAEDKKNHVSEICRTWSIKFWAPADFSSASIVEVVNGPTVSTQKKWKKCDYSEIVQNNSFESNNLVELSAGVKHFTLIKRVDIKLLGLLNVSLLTTLMWALG